MEPALDFSAVDQIPPIRPMGGTPTHPQEPHAVPRESQNPILAALLLLQLQLQL
jgi:hypothetical protein